MNPRRPLEPVDATAAQALARFRKGLSVRHAQLAAVLSLAALGLVGGCLILAQGGFTTASKRALSPIFVPAPQAYVMAAIMFAMSVVAALWVCQQVRARRTVCLAALMGYGVAIVVLTKVLAAYVR